MKMSSSDIADVTKRGIVPLGGKADFEMLEIGFGLKRPPSVWDDVHGMKRVKHLSWAEKSITPGGQGLANERGIVGITVIWLSS